MTDDDMIRWQELSRNLVFDRFTQIEEVQYRLPDGRELPFYIKKTRPAVAVVALTPAKEVLLVRQFRPGPGEVLLELPGGYVDPGETAVEAAARELLEETGYAGRVRLVTHVFDDAYANMHRACAIATDCRRISAPRLDETGEVKLLSLGAFRELLRSGRMTDVEIGYLGLDFLELL